MIRRVLAAALLCACLAGGGAAAAAPHVQPAGARVALVVGDGAYAGLPRLGNPPNDARLVARTLAAMGFTLVGGGARVDLTKAEFDAAVRAFGHAAEGADVALFYYSGHGAQVGGINWLVPVDAPSSLSAQDLDYTMVDAGAVLRQMQLAGTRLNLLILDACRDDPFGKSGRGIGTRGGGLAQMQAPDGTIISYATQPGNVALDGSGQDSPYTTALVDAMQHEAADVFQTFNRVGLEVKRATGGAQQPWIAYSPIEGAFAFNPASPPGPAAASVAAAAAPPGGDQGLARSGSPTVQAGVEALKRRDYAAARDALHEAAEAGDRAAQLDLGLMYRHGWGVPADYAAAARWYERASAQGSAAARASLGFLYMTGGPNLARDDAMALRLTRAAADDGSPLAYNNLGVMYARGQGVARDQAQAVRWYRMAATRNDPQGQLNLGLRLMNGNGAPRDLQEARFWLARAAARGNPQAQAQLARLGTE